MPKKGKKGKKAAAEEAARLEAEKAAAELEAKRKFEEELVARDRFVLLIARRDCARWDDERRWALRAQARLRARPRRFPPCGESERLSASEPLRGARLRWV